MIVWSGWGLVVVLFAALGLFVGASAQDALSETFGLVFGPGQSPGAVIGGLLAASLNLLFTRWREGGESRAFFDEATGQRFEMRPSAGSLFFIPTRYWTWIFLVIAVLCALALWRASGSSSSY